jgi:hypothetical protein
MASRNVAIIMAFALAFSGGAAFAQEQEPTGFYADPVMGDPPTVAVHVYPSGEATSDVAAVAPAVDKLVRPQRLTVCTNANPCAITTPAARG